MLSRVATNPGVYLMKDTKDRIIYVGKAKNLKKRLSSYFQRSDQHDLKTSVLVKKIAAFETIITSSEQEALILEATLIKRYKPRYNVILKDDKRYPFLRINVREPYPFVSVVRQCAKDGALYFGPFTSGKAVQQILKVIRKTFKLRKCKIRNFRNRSRPCLNYQMGVCLGPCCNSVKKETYDDIVKEVGLFLKGRTPELLRKIKEDMLSAAEREDFEIAAELRDKLFAIKKITEKQVVVTSDQLDRDVLAMVQAREYALITILSIRGGYLTASRHFGISETLADREEMIEAFIRQYYEKQPFIPREILVPLALENLTLLETWLKNLKGGYVRVHHPVRGEKRRLMDMALENAEKELQARIESGRAAYERLERLQRRLQMETRPARIECFDNSHIMGNYPVAGMVVFAEGKPDKEAYRKFTIQTVKEPDDYAYMAEIMQRRFGKDGESEPFPDLLMVDGGKGQLNIARAVVDSLGLTGAFQLIGIAKKDERKGETADKIFLPGRSNPVNFGKDADLLLFLQHIRDEAHRFAIRFHRRRRNQGTLQSRLDAIPGIGRQRKKTLLTHFGGVRQLAEASLEDITALPGMNRKVAQAVFETFSGGEQEVGNH
jgi:excinuclease ABC subunit C